MRKLSCSSSRAAIGKTAALFSLILAAVFLAGCHHNPSASGHLKLVYIPKNTGNPYFTAIGDGLKQACDENSMDYAMIAPDTADAAPQIAVIKDQIQRGVNCIALAPDSPSALDPVLDQARQAGIIIVTLDCDLTDNEDHRDASVLPVDPQIMADDQLDLMGSMFGYSGKFAILSSTTDAPNQNLWISIIKKTMTDNAKYKDMQLVEIVYGNDEPQKSQTEAEALIAKYPDLKGILCPTTAGLPAAAQAIEAAVSTGHLKAGQIQVTGLGTPNQMRAFVKDGTCKAFHLWITHDVGYIAGNLAYQLATKKITIQPGVKIQAGTLGQYTANAKNIVFTGPPTTFTADNIDQFNF